MNGTSIELHDAHVHAWEAHCERHGADANMPADPEGDPEREAIRSKASSIVLANPAKLMEARVAKLRDVYGISEDTARDAVANDQRQRLLGQDLNIGGALTLAAEVPDTAYVLDPVLVQGQL